MTFLLAAAVLLIVAVVVLVVGDIAYRRDRARWQVDVRAAAGIHDVATPEGRAALERIYAAEEADDA